MRSVPLAILWEMTHRSRGILAVAALGANALPLILLGLLRREGALEHEDQISIILHVVLVQINMLLFGIVVFGSTGPLSRLFAYPVSTAELVGWHLLLGMAAVGAEVAASVALTNALFGVGWPIWGPALFGAVFVGALQSSLWLTDKSIWIIAGIGVPGAGLGLWMKSRYGPFFSQPKHYWTTLTAGEVAFLAAVALGVYWIGVVGASRNRCGEPPLSTGLAAWLDRVFTLEPRGGSPFRSPAQAQFWFEWRKKGWMTPAIVIMGLIMGPGIWLLVSRDPKSLYEGFVGGGALTILGGFMGGFVLGMVGRNDADLQIGQFLATRPITNTEMARIILKALAKSVLVAWMIWAVAFAALWLLLWALRVSFPLTLPAPFGWWYFPMTLLGMWTAAGLMCAIVLSGRNGLVVGFFFGTMGLFVGLMLFSKWALSAPVQVQFFQGVQFVVGAVLVAATVWAFTVARRRAIVGSATLYAALCAWVALCVLTFFGGVVRPALEPPMYVLAIGLLAVALSPLATTPLALAWNRNR